MTGWLAFLALAAAVFAALGWWLRGRTGAVPLVLAALLVAAAGYAWQGRPGLAGKPVASAADAPASSAGSVFADERRSWFETVGPDPELLDAADTWIARGEPAYAIGFLRSGLRDRPRSVLLWLGLGDALVQYAGGAVTPAARYAYARAAALAPESPGPPYFLGLALAVSGDLDAADRLWRDLLARSAGAAPWRRRVAIKLLILERIRGHS